LFITFAVGHLIFMRYALDKKYNSLNRLGKWDCETQEIIKQRIANELGDVLTYEFLTEKEGEILELLIDTLLPQEKNRKYIKISEIINRDLSRNIRDVRYRDNPWPREFYQKGLVEFRGTAEKKFGKPLEDFSENQLEKYVTEIFTRNSNDFLLRFLRKALSDAAGIYYSHPKAWNEIGFPGPAYPEGYAHLDCGETDEWEPKYEKK